MKKTLFTLLCLLGAFHLFSQSSNPEVIANAGEHVEGTTVQLDWTLGELAISSLENDGLRLTEGFHQPEVTLTAVAELPADLGSLTLFPNPTADWLHLEMTFEQEQTIALELFDYQGKLLWVQEHRGSRLQEQTSLASLAAGTYFLRLSILGQAQQFSYQVQKLR